MPMKRSLWIQRLTLDRQLPRVYGVMIHGDADGRDSDCAEKDEMSWRIGGTCKATISTRVLCSGQVVVVVLGLSLLVQGATQKLKSIPVPGAKPFPESITSTSDGVLFVGRVGD